MSSTQGKKKANKQSSNLKLSKKEIRDEQSESVQKAENLKQKAEILEQEAENLNKKQEAENLNKKQKQKQSYNRWTEEEIEALRVGFKKHGRSWDTIKKDPECSSKLSGRSTTQLEDRIRCRRKNENS